MLKRFITILLLFVLTAISVSAQKKATDKVIVLPPGIKSFAGEDQTQIMRELSDSYYTSFALGLKNRYKEVIAGREVEKIMEESFELLSKSTEKECTEESCRPALMATYGTATFATLDVLGDRDGNFLVTYSVFIQKNTSSQTPLEGTTATCKKCSPGDLPEFIRNFVTNAGKKSGGTSGGIVFDEVSPQPAEGNAGIVIDKQTGGGVNTSGGGKPILVLTSEPSGADVFINGIAITATPANIQENLTAGNIRLELRKERYRTYVIENYTLKPGFNGNELGTIKLLPAFGTLRIEGEPKGAEVFLSGRKQGTLPFSKELDSGGYLLEVKADLHETLKRTVKVDDGKTTTERVSLTPNFGTADLDVSPSGAQVKIYSGNTVVASGNLPQKFRLNPGSYRGEFTKTGYASLTFKLDIARGKTVSLSSSSAKLRRLEGTLNVSSDPYQPGAKVSVNGKEIGNVPFTGKFPAGPAEVTVSTDELSGSLKVTVTDNRTVNVSVKLEKSFGGGSTAGLYAEKHSYKKLSDGSILQEKTGLIWQSEDDGKKRNHADAIRYCENLTKHGKSDWRLPTRVELASLVDYNRYDPAADPILGMKSDDWYWSSSVPVSGSVGAWDVNFEDGYVGRGYHTHDHRVRCVRSGK